MRIRVPLGVTESTTLLSTVAINISSRSETSLIMALGIRYLEDCLGTDCLSLGHVLHTQKKNLWETICHTLSRGESGFRILGGKSS